MSKKFFIVFLFACSISFAQFGGSESHVTIKSYHSFDKVVSGTETKLALEVVVEPEWHINSNKPKEDYLVPSEITITSPEGITLSNVTWPVAKDIKLSFSDIPLSVFEGTFYAGGLLKIPESVKPGKYTVVITLSYQACNNSLCIAPDEISDTLQIEVVDKVTPVNEANQEIFSKLNIQYSQSGEKNSNNEEDSIQSQLEKSGLILSLLLVFVGGLALNLTPCVYPLIPITIGFFGGQSEGNTGRLALMGFLYLLGIALTYSVVGVVTALSGAVFGALLQNPIVILAVVLVLLALSLSMFGVYEFKLPDSLVNKFGDSKGGLFGAFFMGLTMGIVAAPCIGPFVLGLVTYVAAKGEPLTGFLLFFFLALGLGAPYFVLALFSGKIKKLPRAGVWMESVKHIFGFILVGMAIYFLLPLIPKSFSGYILPGYMIFAGIFLLFFEKSANSLRGFRIFKIVFSIVIIGLAVWLLIPVKETSIAWKTYSDAEFTKSTQNGERIIIDFYADWCIPCKELDKFTFSDIAVIEESKRFTGFKADLTKSTDPVVEKLRKDFQIIGVPTVLIIDGSGTEVERITGFVNAKEFIEILKKVQ